MIENETWKVATNLLHIQVSLFNLLVLQKGCSVSVWEEYLILKAPKLIFSCNKYTPVIGEANVNCGLQGEVTDVMSETETK